MHALLILTVLVLWPFLAGADVKWHEFAVSEGVKKTMTIGVASVTIETRPIEETAFGEDHLVIIVRRAGRAQMQQWFTSSYGMGAVAIHDDILLLKYGAGRGTSARVEHVKALTLTHSLEELFDVQTSYYVDGRDPKKVSPDSVEYRVKVHTSGDYTSITFWTPKSRRGIPSEKIVRLKNDG